MKGIGDYISREAVVNEIWKALYSYEDEMEAKFMDDPELDVSQWFFYRIFVQTMSSIDLQVILDAPAADVRPVPEGGIGEMSDGYHTFNGLYYQRMVLFAALVIAHNDKAWKSWKHEDGEPCFGGGWFIVGIDTPQGSYTYHYEGKYWNWFECEELPVAKHWDGHTEEDVTRLLSLDMPRWIPVTERLPEAGERVLCYCRANIYEVMKMRTDGDWVYDVHHIYMHSFVTHWMPLPEPPEEERA